MRSVPHRVLCLVGMDDGAFPRTVIADGDDVMARDPLLGERDPRSEDRQVLLDAIMAATDYLVITYAGADERTNQQRPPCVPLGDLLDTVDAMAVTGAGDPAHTQVRVQHPLQPFDRRNFLPGALGSPGPFGHDRSALQAARRAAEPREPAPGLLMADLPPLPFDVMSPQDLGTFLTSPPKAYLRARLGLSLYEDDEAAAEQIPIEVKGLAKWQVGNRSLRLLTRGEPPQKVAGAERARGHLPPGALGEQTLRDVGGEALVIAQRFAEHANGPARQVGVALDLPGGVRVVGTVPDIHATAIVRATFSKAKPKDELRMWPELLALAVAQPERRWTACLIHHDGGFRLTAPPAEESRGLLAGLVELYRAGMCSPLPLFPATSCTYAKRRVEGKDHDHSRRAAQFGSWQRHAEERRLDEVVALWGEDAELEEILRESPRAGENWFDEDSRFGMLARRLWEPVLAAREDL
jgi:exodeoxyribonuclease V gamma subunit